jgi:hypothetical protein
MDLYVPRLVIQLDPLIAEAKRRARRRRLIGVTLVLVVLGVGALGRWELSGANASAATPDSGTQCAGPGTYGVQCIDLSGSGLRVEKIETWNWAVAALTPVTWRMDLERYLCDPIGKTKSACSAATTWHGRARTDVPIVNRRALTPHLVQSRSHRYWPTFTMPHTFPANGWLCTELAIYNTAAHRWVYNAAGLPHGLRACVTVHA